VDKYSNSVGIVVKLVEALSYSEPSVRQWICVKSPDFLWAPSLYFTSPILVLLKVDLLLESWLGNCFLIRSRWDLPRVTNLASLPNFLKD
jgi:hypothetical protein